MMKDPNRLMEKEFHKWLDKCPNDWIRLKSDEDSNTYSFFRKDVEEDKKFEVFNIGAGEFIRTNSGEVIWGSEAFIDEVFKACEQGHKLLELINDMGWDYDRFSSSGQDTYDKICVILGTVEEDENETK